LFFRWRKMLRVDVDRLEGEQEKLLDYLRKKIGANLAIQENKIFVDSGVVSSAELKHLVNKFVYRQNLNHKYWVELDGNTVRLHRFKHFDKKKDKEKGTTPSTIRHGW